VEAQSASTSSGSRGQARVDHRARCLRGFLASYAWRARGAEYADKVTETGWRLFAERLAAAREVLQEARKLPEKDPFGGWFALRVALGESWPKEEYDQLVEEAVSFEPKFWGYHVTRAYSLLPRWHGEPGDWEAYAEQAAERPDGLRAEIYARIVIRLEASTGTSSQESKVSWPKTARGAGDDAAEISGFARGREQRCPARFHGAGSRDGAADVRQIGDQYLPSVWRKPERFVHCRNWAETGQW
jgi:hypothetical protein